MLCNSSASRSKLHHCGGGGLSVGLFASYMVAKYYLAA